MKDRFTKTFVFSIIILLVIIVFLSFLNLNQKTVLTNYEERKEDVVFTFSRIVDNKSVKVKITPDIPNKVFVKGKKVSVYFENPLRSSSTYLLEFESIKDQYGENIQINKKEIITKDQTYTYLRDKKQIVEGYVGKNGETVLVEDSYIRNYSINSKYIAYVTGKITEKENKLYLVDRRTREKKEIGFSGNVVKSVIFSNVSNELSYVSQRVDVTNGEISGIGNNLLFTYDIEQNIVKQRGTNESDIYEIYYHPNNNDFLLKTADTTYMYLSGESLTPLGKHFGSGGFSKDGKKILFIDSDPLLPGINSYITVFDENRNLESIIDKNIFQIDPKYINKRNDVIFVSKDYSIPEFAIGEVQVFKEGKITKRFKDGKLSYEFPNVTEDNKYLSIEAYNEIDFESNNIDAREYAYQIKPLQGKIRIYDFERDTFVKELNGVLLQWN